METQTQDLEERTKETAKKQRVSKSSLANRIIRGTAYSLLVSVGLASASCSGSKGNPRTYTGTIISEKVESHDYQHEKDFSVYVLRTPDNRYGVFHSSPGQDSLNVGDNVEVTSPWGTDFFHPRMEPWGTDFFHPRMEYSFYHFPEIPREIQSSQIINQTHYGQAYSSNPARNRIARR